jgi:hypothetical protein
MSRATGAFDRYWRNARVLASHNSAIIREAAIGDFCAARCGLHVAQYRETHARYACATEQP